MSLAVICTRACLGLDAPEVLAEVHLSSGLPAFNIVGLPETAVRESKDRVRSALLNAGFEFPLRRITVNLAPADLPKEGGRYDLPIALGILTASEQLPADALRGVEFIGELSLTGKIRKIRGALTAVRAAGRAGHTLILPRGNKTEVSLCRNSKALPAGSLLEVTAHLTGQTPLARVRYTQADAPEILRRDLSEVKGQFRAKRALEIAAAGGHGLLMYGPPGTGKTMLAECLPGILPPLSEEEALEVASISTLAAAGGKRRPGARPFRTPHHTASGAAMCGGGSVPGPGEITLAHLGVLFLDELPEFDRKVLEVLRQPLESGEVTVSRAAGQITFPAAFQLVTAMNPCPCGYLGDKSRECICTPAQIQRYRRKISGPLLDRIDMHTEVSRLPPGEMTARSANKTQVVTSQTVRDRVGAARALQLRRQKCLNAALSPGLTEQHIVLGAAEEALVIKAAGKLNLSGRALHRMLKVARTIADLEAKEQVGVNHLSEAISYRPAVAV